MLPYVVGLCPTYRRPALLENTIACWNKQDYPTGRRELVICDDAQEIAECFGHGWWLYRTPRFNSICDKYNSMARDAAPTQADIFFVIEDDEIYMPWHVSSHVNAYLRDPAGLAQPRWAQSETVFSLYTGALQQEGSDGRFHAALSFNRAMFDAVGGWPNTRQANFDQQLISNMKGIAPRCGRLISTENPTCQDMFSAGRLLTPITARCTWTRRTTPPGGMPCLA